MLKISWVNVQSALVYGVLTALLMMALYAISIGNMFALDMKDLANAGAFGFITVIVSLLKNLLTSDAGNFLGAVKVIPNVEEVK